MLESFHTVVILYYSRLGPCKKTNSGLPKLVELSSYRLMEMCHWMGSHFHNWIDHNEVAFPIELQSWAAYFRDLGA